MGMYTEIVCGFSLKPDAPPLVIDTLRFMIEGGDEPAVLPQHDLFTRSRWRMLLTCSSYYFGVNRAHAAIWCDDIQKEWSVSARANLKNYEGEIEAFFDWITPFVSSGSGDNELIGYSICEQANAPTLYYAASLKEEKEK